MQWWAWILVGAVLLGAELTFVDADFYLVFLGISALIVGSIEIAGPGLPFWAQWLLYAFLSIAAMVTFRQRLYQRLRGGLPAFEDSFNHELVVLPKALAPGGSCRVELRGSTWTVRNEEGQPLSAGQRVRVTRINGVILGVGALASTPDPPESD